MQRVSVALILQDDLVLGVSRKYDITAMGLPGGKAEGDESDIDCLYREIFEETGLTIITHDLVYSRYDDGIDQRTYLCTTSGSISTNEDGRVAYVNWQELFDGPFGVYNKNLYNHLKSERIII